MLKGNLQISCWLLKSATGQGTKGSTLDVFLNNRPSPNQSTTPKAYVNIIFFDEQFKYVKESSDFVMVEELGSGTSITGARALSKTATKNGYVYVYISNETDNIPVYFDDFTVTHDRRPITEDNAYYPFGLKIQGISGKAALKATAKYGYQGDFSEQDEETGYNEFALRSYDPQIGRWIQVDPNDVEPGMYNGMNNDPINNIDPDGGNPDWGSKKNEDGTITHQWFEGIDNQAGMPSGWTWEGKNPGSFYTVWGMTATLLDHGIVVYGKSSPSVFGRNKINFNIPEGYGDSFEDQVRNYVNISRDAKIGASYGFIKTGWESLKGLGTFLSFATAPGEMFKPGSEFGQMQRDLLGSFYQLANQSQLNGTNSMIATIGLNYGANAYNAFANGDFFDGTSMLGKMGFDGLSLYAGGEGVFGVTKTGSAKYWIQGTDKSTLNTMMKGRYAVKSITWDATRNFNTIRGDLNAIGQKYGCHTCGVKTSNGVYIPDHQPSLKLNPNGPFELFPHCPSCSRLQGGQVNKAVHY